MKELRIALAQQNYCVGDIAVNAAKIIATAVRARDELGADLVAFPELALTGYPPEDLLFRPGLHRRVAAALDDIRQAATGIHILVGYPEAHDGHLYNACSLFHDGRLIATYRKHELPNYSVFDEKRYFAAGDEPCVVTIEGVRVAFNICEDIWKPHTATAAAAAGAELILVVNASPFHAGKRADRVEVLRKAAATAGVPLVYVNLVGGQDELVFDGGSLAVDAAGAVCYSGAELEEALDLLVVQRAADGSLALAGPQHPELRTEESVYRALVLGVGDYIRKNRFHGAVLGISGGIDSALTLALAADAIGAHNVMGVSMPSHYTAQMSIDDALQQARTLGCETHVVSIGPPLAAFTEVLEPVFAGAAADVTEENIQSRCRGIILMAISNKQGRIVLATGNKSEMSVGYATLYGDMAGGFAPLKDVPKTLVYRLAQWRNRDGEVIPDRVITRPPSAELAPDQKDTDSLPPYEILDPILERYIERDQTPREIWEAGFEPEVVTRVASLVDRNEYKRRQAAPGVRITQRAFGRDRRVPITSCYSEHPPLAPK